MEDEDRNGGLYAAAQQKGRRGVQRIWERQKCRDGKRKPMYSELRLKEDTLQASWEPHTGLQRCKPCERP